MMRFFKRTKTNLKPPERRIFFLLNDGSWKKHYRIEGEPRLTFNELITTTQNMFKERYVGAFDHYTFFLKDDTILEFMSKFSYEEIWDMWNSMGKPNEFGDYKMSNDEEMNKFVFISFMLSAGAYGCSTGNVELDNKLAYDYVLISLARSSRMRANKKEFGKLFWSIEGIMKSYSLPENEVENFTKIINSIKKSMNT